MMDGFAIYCWNHLLWINNIRKSGWNIILWEKIIVWDNYMYLVSCVFGKPYKLLPDTFSFIGRWVYRTDYINYFFSFHGETQNFLFVMNNLMGLYIF